MIFLATISLNQYPGIGKKPDRLKNWFEYYNPIKGYFGVDAVVSSTDSNVINGSIGMPVVVWGNIHPDVQLSRKYLNLLTFEAELPTRVNEWTNPIYWRSLAQNLLLARALGCPKMVLIESDTFIQTGRLAGRIHAFDGGMAMCWCPLHKFPECQIMVICQDRYDVLLEGILCRGWDEWGKEQPIENIPEYWLGRVGQAEIWDDLIGDRYSEYSAWENPRGMKPYPPPDNCDFVAQAEGYRAHFTQ